MDLHDKIMNIQVDKEKMEDALDTIPEPNKSWNDWLRRAYTVGYRDARHAAAELVVGEEKSHFDNAYLKGLKGGRTDALVYGHIPVERLRKMTIDDICVLVCEDANQSKRDNGESFYRTNEGICPDEDAERRTMTFEEW